MKLRNIFILLFFLCFKETFAESYFKGGSIAGGMGWAGRASNDGTEGFLLNPAILMYSPPRSLGAFYSFYKPSKPDNFYQRFMGLSFTDNNQDSYFSGGFSVFKAKKNFLKEGKFDETYFHLSLADFTFGRVIFGISAYYLRSKEDRKGGRAYRQINSVWGLHYAPYHNFAMAFVHYNYLPSSSSVPLHIRQKKQIALGFQYIPMVFLKMRLDLNLPLEENPKKKGIYQLGMETFANKLISFRLGVELNDVQSQISPTGGLGFNSPRFRLNYAIQKDVKNSSSPLRHSLDLKIPY